MITETKNTNDKKYNAPNWTDITIAMTAIVGVVATGYGLILVYFQLISLNHQIVQEEHLVVLLMAYY